MNQESRLPRQLLIVGLVLCSSATLVTVAWAGGRVIAARSAGEDAIPVASPAPPSEVSAPAPSPAAEPSHRVFPVTGEASYRRVHHGYPATDIFAPCGTTVVAVYTGTILEVNRTDDYDAAVNAGVTRGGLSVSLLGDDQVRYYGSHFSKILDAVQPGARVAAGQPLGEVGMTGDAAACHLHFGLSPVCYRTSDWWNRRGVIWPWPYLDSWRSGGDLDPRPELDGFEQSTGCPDHATVEP